VDNQDLVLFGYTFAGLSSDVREQIERIVEHQNQELPDHLLEELCIPDLQRALAELQCCNVRRLVRVVERACQEAESFQG